MKYLFTTLFLMTFWSLQGQYEIKQNSGKIEVIEVNEVTFEGHSGSTILIEPEGGQADLPERAKGLKVISPGGLTDNTGIGLSIKTEGDVTTVKAVSTRSEQRYIIKVPKSVSIYYESSTHMGEDLYIKDLDSEIEVSASFNDIHLDNPTGPLSVSTVHGSIDADFESVNQDHSISLYSVHDHVDVTVPANTQANFRLSTNFGDMFTDLDLDVGKKDGVRKISNEVIGKYNGGGVDFSIRSSHDNVYLRKK